MIYKYLAFLNEMNKPAGKKFHKFVYHQIDSCVRSMHIAPFMLLRQTIKLAHAFERAQ